MAVLNDLLYEFDESFTFVLSNAVHAVLPADPAATGTITDNDDPPELSVDDTVAFEGEVLTFTVRLSAPSSRVASFFYTTEECTGLQASSILGRDVFFTCATSGDDYRSAVSQRPQEYRGRHDPSGSGGGHVG